jgi:hypothetical protein
MSCYHWWLRSYQLNSSQATDTTTLPSKRRSRTETVKGYQHPLPANLTVPSRCCQGPRWWVGTGSSGDSLTGALAGCF